MPSCAICRTDITAENDSFEHLIPQSIGGRKKIPGFLCRDCNARAGQGWDAELARQLNPMSLLLNIRRERGDVPAQTIATVSGDRYRLQSDGGLALPKPDFEKMADPKGVKISITARSMEEATQMVAGVKRKYPHIDVEAIMRDVVSKKSYLNDLLKIELNFGGTVSGRSIVKSAFALAVAEGVSIDVCDLATGYLRDTAANARWDYFYQTDLITDRPAGVPLHCVAVRGCAGKLVGYVEYYGHRRMWVPLSDRYTGSNVDAHYAIDPVSGFELRLTIKPIPLTMVEEPVKAQWAGTKQALEAIMGPAMAAARERELERVVGVAWEKARQSILASEALTEKQQWERAREIVECLLPFIQHQLSDPFKNFHP